jgi:hypothetical protein
MSDSCGRNLSKCVNLRAQMRSNNPRYGRANPRPYDDVQLDFLNKHFIHHGRWTSRHYNCLHECCVHAVRHNRPGHPRNWMYPQQLPDDEGSSLPPEELARLTEHLQLSSNSSNSEEPHHPHPFAARVPHAPRSRARNFGFLTNQERQTLQQPATSNHAPGARRSGLAPHCRRTSPPRDHQLPVPHHNNDNNNNETHDFCHSPQPPPAPDSRNRFPTIADATWTDVSILESALQRIARREGPSYQQPAELRDRLLTARAMLLATDPEFTPEVSVPATASHRHANNRLSRDQHAESPRRTNINLNSDFSDPTNQRFSSASTNPPVPTDSFNSPAVIHNTDNNSIPSTCPQQIPTTVEDPSCPTTSAPSVAPSTSFATAPSYSGSTVSSHEVVCDIDSSDSSLSACLVCPRCTRSGRPKPVTRAASKSALLSSYSLTSRTRQPR